MDSKPEMVTAPSQVPGTPVPPAASAHPREKPPAPPGLMAELQECWRQFPAKQVFFPLLAAWILLFHFLGNSTLGYTATASIFKWLQWVYSRSPDDELGYIMPVVVLGLFWYKRQELMALEKRPWWPALGVVALGLVVHIAGFMLQQTRISLVGFFLGLYGLMGCAWGWKFMQASFFPFFLFAFCLPLGRAAEFITFPLRLIVTKIAVVISGGLLGIDVVRNGTQIFDSQRTFQFEVAAACSGIRSLFSLFALTIIYAFLNFTSWWKRGLIMALALPLAVAGNVLRILAIIIAAEAFGQQAGVFMDTWFGYVSFGLALICVLLIGNYLRNPRKLFWNQPVSA